MKKIKGALGRAAVLETPHGCLETPAFVVVGTKATVKALTPEQIEETGAQVVLGNIYHLYLEPGERVVAAAGGLGKFMGWDGPTMTDSGGFQVFSLGALYTNHGRINIENAKYKNDFAPVKDGCACYTCCNFTKAYLAHLFRSGEILANTLATIHNVYFTVQLVKKMRQAILDGVFPECKKDFLKTYKR